MPALDRKVLANITKKGEIVTNWILRFSDNKEYYIPLANKICMEHFDLADGEINNILDGKYLQYELSTLVQMSKRFGKIKKFRAPKEETGDVD